MKILLVEDDDFIITLLTRSLSSHHYVVDVVKDGEMGWTYGFGFEYDLLILDVVLPNLDGISLCQRLRAEGLTTPILLLTAQDSSIAKVQGLNAGADDYVVKPFDPLELVARIQALLRRSSANLSPVLTWGDLRLNPSTCEVTYNAQPLILTTKEYDLLELFLRDSHHVFSSDEILDRLWSSEEFPAEATVRSHVRRLRHKLQGLGAPQDFIGTLHGRGYYLKPSRPNPPYAISPAPKTQHNNLEPHSIDPTEAQQQYLAFLNDTWGETQLNCLGQLTILSNAVQTLQTGSLALALQQQAHQVAHKLAGTLGIFGFTQGTQIARRLEQMLSNPNELPSEKSSLLETLTAALRAEIQNAPSVVAPQPSSEDAPLFLIMDPDARFWDPFIPLAAQQGLRIAIAPTLEVASAWLATIPETTDLAKGILVRLSAWHNQDGDLGDANAWNCLQTLISAHPNLPLLILGDQDNLSDRLAVLRQGGKFLLEQSVTPEQLVAHMVESLHQPPINAKIMIVDDDQTWLNTLPKLLEPWKFKITTLADPQQFWTVLKSVCPDVLVLDIKMPQIDGFELCQVLRNDPHWQQLPVLFVSALDDSKTQNQAFTVGADDYLCKPIVGAQLANRILNRLQRMQSVCCTHFAQNISQG